MKSGNRSVSTRQTPAQAAYPASGTVGGLGLMQKISYISQLQLKPKVQPDIKRFFRRQSKVFRY